jgi:predicted phage terminase large subunit-like protein
VRGQWSPDRLDKIFEETAKADSPEIPIVIGREPGASGLITTNHFKKLLGPQFRIRDVPELQNKVTKAHGMLAGAERGDLILKYAPWNEAFADEFDSIPDGEHDDQIDCAAIGWNELIGVPKISAVWGRSNAAPDSTQQNTPARSSGGVIWGKRKSGLVVPIKR